MNYYVWFHKQAHSAQCLCSWFSRKDWEKLLNVNYLITIPNICLCQVSMIWLYKVYDSMSPQFFLSIFCTILMKRKRKEKTLPLNGITQTETEMGSIRQPASYSSGRQKDYDWIFKSPVNKFSYTTGLSWVLFLLNEAFNTVTLEKKRRESSLTYTSYSWHIYIYIHIYMKVYAAHISLQSIPGCSDSGISTIAGHQWTAHSVYHLSLQLQI